MPNKVLIHKLSHFGIVGTAIHHGQRHTGVTKGYEYLKQIEDGKFWKYIHQKFQVRDFGTLPSVRFKATYQNLFNKITKIMEEGFKPLALGGDHSQSLASIRAVRKYYPNLRIIWIDAHADINTPETSPSGNIHGMPISFLLEPHPKQDPMYDFIATDLSSNLLSSSAFCLFGVRDIDKKEHKNLSKHKIKYYSPDELQTQGLENIFHRLSEKWKEDPVHLSFDIDGLDSAIAPATTTPVPKGLSLKSAEKLIQLSHKHFNLVSAEIVEFNPELANNSNELKITSTTIKKIIDLILTNPTASP